MVGRREPGEALKGLCRDCGLESNTPLAACPSCGGRRMVAHPELGTLGIAHIDCDAFYASVEKRDDPTLRDQPVIVGGGKRGVVAAACYHARVFGVRSAMPMFKALELCPQAVVIRPQMGRYSREGHRIRALMRALTPLVEPVSIDEAYLDLRGTEALHGAPPAVVLSDLQKRIAREVGVTVSVGLSHNKFLAKTASELDKPHGFAVIGRRDAQALLDGRDVGALHGIGPRFAAALRAGGLHSVRDVRAKSERDLGERWGEAGLRLYRIAHGRDDRPVKPERERKSVSAETTFSEDIGDLARLKDRLWHTCARASARAKAQGVAGRVVVLKLKTRRFHTLTRRRSLEAPVQLADQIFRACLPLLEREADGREFRLVGAGIAELSPFAADPTGDLLDPQAVRRAAAERAGDRARERFGEGVLQTGRGLRVRRERDQARGEARGQTEEQVRDPAGRSRQG